MSSWIRVCACVATSVFGRLRVVARPIAHFRPVCLVLGVYCSGGVLPIIASSARTVLGEFIPHLSMLLHSPARSLGGSLSNTCLVASLLAFPAFLRTTWHAFRPCAHLPRHICVSLSSTELPAIEECSQHPQRQPVRFSGFHHDPHQGA